MPDEPLAYFITFTTHGTWLHGSPGSVDRNHNTPGTPFLPPVPQRLAANLARMTQEPYLLDDPRRTVVRDAIVEACEFRGWRIHALHVRTNHVYLVVTADREPEFVDEDLQVESQPVAQRRRFRPSGSEALDGTREHEV